MNIAFITKIIFYNKIIFHPDAVDALLYASRQYAYDCGEESGNESKNKKEAEQQESRNATLPEWMRGDSNDY